MASPTVNAEDLDLALVARMAEGDQAAVSDLYDRYRTVVYGLALRVLRDRSEAEEVLADVFLQAWRGAARFDPGRGSVPAWLITLCRSRAIDRVRARGRREAVHAALARENPDTAAGGVTPPGDPLRGMDLLMKRRRISAALGALAAPQRAAIELAYYGGLTQSEIAERLGEPLGTVKTRIRQGLMALRESLVGGVDEM